MQVNQEKLVDGKIDNYWLNVIYLEEADKITRKTAEIPIAWRNWKTV